MALQDLTPQLRTRLSRMERAVGWFIFLATVLLAFGFGYYIYHTAKRNGWFTPKVTYQTGVNNAAGLKVGDPVKLMGFDAGQITRIEPNDPSAYYGVTVFFAVKEPNYGYIWGDSTVKVSADFLGNRYLEIIKGKVGLPTVVVSNKVIACVLNHKAMRDRQKELVKAGQPLDQTWSQLKTECANNFTNFYQPFNSETAVWIHPDESPALNERLERVANQVELALPNILNLTNRIAAVLDNATTLTSNLNVIALGARPVVASLAGITATADTNLPATFDGVDRTLDNLANITSNLNVQVQANSNLLATAAKSLADTDDLVQGLKRHWLLRSAFKTTPKTNSPPVKSMR